METSTKLGIFTCATTSKLTLSAVTWWCRRGSKNNALADTNMAIQCTTIDRVFVETRLVSAWGFHADQNRYATSITCIFRIPCAWGLQAVNMSVHVPGHYSNARFETLTECQNTPETAILRHLRTGKTSFSFFDYLAALTASNPCSIYKWLGFPQSKITPTPTLQRSVPPSNVKTTMCIRSMHEVNIWCIHVWEWLTNPQSKLHSNIKTCKAPSPAMSVHLHQAIISNVTEVGCSSSNDLSHIDQRLRWKATIIVLIKEIDLRAPSQSFHGSFVPPLTNDETLGKLHLTFSRWNWTILTCVSLPPLDRYNM